MVKSTVGSCSRRLTERKRGTAAVLGVSSYVA